MKIIWIILIFVMVFNGMAMFTNSLGIFQIEEITPSMSEEDIMANYSNLSKNEEGIGRMGILGFGFNWADVGAVIAGVLTLTGAIGIAYFTRSPVPLGVGAFLAFTVALWIKTYFVFNQFGINQYFLTVGMASMGIMFVATTIEMITGGHNA